MNLILTRDNPTGPDCTLGILTLEEHRWQTLERPWVPDPDHIGGHPETSCVPPGTYRLIRHDTPKHPKTWELWNPELGVGRDPGMRTAILIHPANKVSELQGCIAIGMSRVFGGEWLLVQSRVAFAELQAALSWIDGHELVIE